MIYILKINKLRPVLSLILYDDHPFVTDAIEKYLSSYRDICVVSKTHTVATTLEQLILLEPDILISDVFSDENSGTTLFNEALKKLPNLRIIVFSSLTNTFLIDSLIEMGVTSSINKKDGFDKLYQELLHISSVHRSKEKSKIELPTLTLREKEIIYFLAKGHGSKEIANALRTSIHTIENQKKALLKKFDCTNSTELIVRLGHMGLLGMT